MYFHSLINCLSLLFALLLLPLLSIASPQQLPLPVSGEVDARLRAAGEGPFLIFLAPQMCGAPDNRATQMSLTLTRVPVARPDNGRGNLEGRGNKNQTNNLRFLLSSLTKF